MRAFIFTLSSFAMLTCLPTSASAELRTVEIKVLGMDCVTCAYGVRVGLERVAGVEAVDVSLEGASAKIRLRPGNRVTLGEIRSIVKRNGFDSGTATVSAIATVVERGGAPVVAITGTNMSWKLSERGEATGVRVDAVQRARAQSTTPLEIVGHVPAPAKASQADQIDLTAIKAVQPN